MASLEEQAHDAQREAEKADLSARANPSANGFLDAARKWSAAAGLYGQLADKGEIDWCTVAEAYLHVAYDQMARAQLDKSPGEAVSDVRDGSGAYEKAADLYIKCGDAAMREEDYSRAIEAYTKAAFGRSHRGAAEKIVEEHYAKLVSQHPGDNVFSGQKEQAEKRREQAENDQEQARKKRDKAREKFLEVSQIRTPRKRFRGEVVW